VSGPPDNPTDARPDQPNGKALLLRAGEIEVHNRCDDYTSYRAARVKSLFNADSGCNFDLVADLPIDDADWRAARPPGSVIDPGVDESRK